MTVYSSSRKSNKCIPNLTKKVQPYHKCKTHMLKMGILCWKFSMHLITFFSGNRDLIHYINFFKLQLNIMPFSGPFLSIYFLSIFGLVKIIALHTPKVFISCNFSKAVIDWLVLAWKMYFVFDTTLVQQECNIQKLQ